MLPTCLASLSRVRASGSRCDRFVTLVRIRSMELRDNVVTRSERRVAAHFLPVLAKCASAYSVPSHRVPVGVPVPPPVSCSRSTIGFRSLTQQRRKRFRQTSSVEPPPANGSTTTSNGLVYRYSRRSTMADSVLPKCAESAVRSLKVQTL